MFIKFESDFFKLFFLMSISTFPKCLRRLSEFDSKTKKPMVLLGGGNSNIFGIFTLKIGGFMIQFDVRILFFNLVGSSFLVSFFEASASKFGFGSDGEVQWHCGLANPNFRRGTKFVAQKSLNEFF